LYRLEPLYLGEIGIIELFKFENFLWENVISEGNSSKNIERGGWFEITTA